MENKLTVKDSAISFLSTCILCQLGTLFFAVIGLIIANMFNVTSELFMNFLNTCLGSFLLSLTMDAIIIVCFYSFNKKKNNKIISKPNIKKISFYILVAVLCYLTLYPVVSVVNSLIYTFFPQRSLSYPLTTGNYFISLISMVILPAIAEELLFRCLIFKGLQKSGNLFAITVSSLMFALFHLSLEQTIYPILMGLVFAVIMCYENNIIYCIVVHLANNFITLTLEYFKISLVFNHWSYYIITLIAAIIFTTTLIIIIKKFILTNNSTSTTKLNTEKQSKKISNEHKIYLALSLTIITILWLIVQLTTIF